MGDPEKGMETEKGVEILPEKFDAYTGKEAVPILERAARRLKIVHGERNEFWNGVTENIEGLAKWIKFSNIRLQYQTIRLISGVALATALLSACSPMVGGANYNAERQEVGSSIVARPPEKEYVVEWDPVSSKDIENYFNLAESPYQKWENVATKPDQEIYTFQLIAHLSRDQNTNEVTLNTDTPSQESYTFYYNPGDPSHSYLINEVGIIEPSNIEEAYLKNAIGHFSGSKIDLLMAGMAEVPKKPGSTIPRYLSEEDVGIQFVRFMGLGPLVANAPTGPTPPDSEFSSLDIALKSNLWKSSAYYIRVTNQDRQNTIFKARPLMVIDHSPKSG